MGNSKTVPCNPGFIRLVNLSALLIAHSARVMSGSSGSDCPSVVGTKTGINSVYVFAGTAKGKGSHVQDSGQEEPCSPPGTNQKQAMG